VLRERFAEITAMDRAIGNLRDYLDEKGLETTRSSGTAATTAHPPSGAATVPFRGMKGTIYEGGVRVPGIIEWPARISKPRTTDVNTVTSDMLPTLCDSPANPCPTARSTASA
jgi:arylsulfatase A-like enzyme